MSLKNTDSKNRWRNKTVVFRVSPEEDEQIESAVRLSGFTKQDYITRRLMCRDVVVQGNPRVYKALRHISADYERIKRAFVPEKVESAVDAAKQREQAEKARKRPRRSFSR